MELELSVADNTLAYPAMRGTGELPATQEVHIFLGPLNPDAATVQRYEEAVAHFNLAAPYCPERGADAAEFWRGAMKSCHLALVFRSVGGADSTVRVMQSAQYVYDNDTARVVAWANKTADYFRAAGFEVLREKIEATAYGIAGVPRTDAEALAPAHAQLYFEFHIAVRRVDAGEHGPLRDDELAALKGVSRALSARFDVPVPLSYNQSKEGTDEGHQRFLNVRFRKCGMDTIKPQLAAVSEAIDATGLFKVRKTISEYVWYDTLPALDHGWIDFSPDEWARHCATAALQATPAQE